MKQYDAIVIGSGSGMNIAQEALEHGMKVALVDRGPLGGTCLNLGCIPSKLLIFPADRIMEIQEASKLGIQAQIKSIDFNFIMGRMRKIVTGEQKGISLGILQTKNLDFYEALASFIADYTLQVKGETIKGKHIFIASGSRPVIPPIKGLDGTDYLTSENVLQLTRAPESMTIIGGGYIAVEYGHFFAAMGTDVTIIEMADRLLLSEEPEISGLLKNEMSKRMRILLNTQALEIKKSGKGCIVAVKDTSTGVEKELLAEKLMVAVGRRSNADLLKVENTGVETDKRGFIKVNEYFETSKKNIFAVGDINGLHMFTHSANRQAIYTVHNVLHGAKLKMDLLSAPHAVFSHPQIASVGLTEAAARKDFDILVGIARYSDVAKGEAMMEQDGFAKAIVEKESRKILGFHIIGPYAPEIIQEVINAMASGGNVDSINIGLHIHPALSELIQSALAT